MNANDEAYVDTLYSVYNSKTTDESIPCELLGARILFNAHDRISYASSEYIDNELAWYLSRDLSIKNHIGIENNKIWQSVASDKGHINSNYGWCIFSKENNEQYNHALGELIKDQKTKHAVMIYSRPTMNEEWNDNKHAKYDMICTVYVSYLLRAGKLNAFVHMRSNDAWRGLRNDLAWQQYVLNKLVDDLNMNHVPCEHGAIYWNADSLHLYARDKEKVKKILHETGHLVFD